MIAQHHLYRTPVKHIEFDLLMLGLDYVQHKVRDNCIRDYSKNIQAIGTINWLCFDTQLVYGIFMLLYSLSI